MLQKYLQTRDERAALLRQVIAERGAHDAPFHPTTFVVWYEHFAGINPALSAAVAEMLGSRPPDGSAHCLALFNIDHFKRVSDAYGHPVGDTGIASVGRVLAHIAAPAQLHAARIGGEEFALLMPATSATQAQQTAETVRKLVKAMKLKRRGTQDVIATMTTPAAWSTPPTPPAPRCTAPRSTAATASSWPEQAIGMH